MADYSGRKHIVSALMRRYTDRIPVTTLIGPYCSRLTNYSVREILQNAKKRTELTIFLTTAGNTDGSSCQP